MPVHAYPLIATLNRPDTAIHENDIPAFVGPELERLYGTLYSSLHYFHTCGGLEGASTYVARRNGKAAAIFLFRQDGDKVRVLNEGMRLQAEEICRFARCMFASRPSARMVIFHAVQADRIGNAFLHQRFFCAQDFIVPLPATQEAFLARLGAATRKNLKRHRHRLERDFPSFTVSVRQRGDAGEADIRRIIELSRQRRTAKGKPFDIDDQETQRIVRLVQRCGSALVATIDGRICGGALMLHIGNSHHSRVNAHDPAFDDYRLGTLCCLLAINEAIACGAARFHLGNTYNDSKTALLGEFHPFDHIAIYRSPLALLINAGEALKTARTGYALQTNRWFLHNASQNNGMPWRMARMLLTAWSAAKKRKPPAR
ncbi:GNAT family N-acetyltransferase [Herbaspirillum sp. HC18]|nr:GNAT family N-acetyltransferase [Herbaspirillum sp. HC18]